VSLARILAVGVALVMCGWFVIGARQAIETDQSAAIIAAATPPSPAQAARASSLLRAAALLNPDRGVDLLRSELALRLGDSGRARKLALGVAQDEPANIDAWLAYGRASAHDEPAFARALRQIQALAPPVKPPT
jgi:hypothetical protein